MFLQFKIIKDETVIWCNDHRHTLRSGQNWSISLSNDTYLLSEAANIVAASGKINTE